MDSEERYEKLSEEDRIALIAGKKILDKIHRKKIVKMIGLSLVAIILLTAIFCVVKTLV